MKIIKPAALLFFIVYFNIAIGQKPDTLVVGYNIVPPFVNLENDELSGPSIWLWEKIAEELGVQFVYRRYSLDSLLLALKNAEIDISAAPLTITRNRAKYLEYSIPYFIAHESLLVKETSSFARTMDFIRSVFSLNFFKALAALAFVILVFGLLVWLFERKHNKDEFGKTIHGWWDGFWWSAVTMTAVGYGDKSPKTIGGRVVAIIWMFTAIIIISGFTASITSSLTIQKIDSGSATIEDFKNKTLGTIANSGTDEWLKDNFFLYKRTYHNLDDMITALKKGEVDAVVYERSILQSVIANDTLLEYKLLRGNYNAHYFAFGMQKNIPKDLRDRINLIMLDITSDTDWKVFLSKYNLD